MVKKSSTTKIEKSESLLSESPMKETPPQVMQVVEVMDEEEKNVDVQDVESEKTKEEKHQEIVSEFFAKKEQPVSPVGYPDISVHKKSPIKGVILWALGVFAIVALIGFIIISASRGGIKMPEIGAKPTPTVTPAPTAVPTPIVDRKSLKVQVLNGSGIAGVAGTMKTLLEEKGYTVSGTGNAKTYDYANTEIQVTAEKESFLSILQADLAGSYTIGSTAAGLKSSSLYDAVVIIGKE
ncbi:MAG: LytR C-terminal domain-containing protein [Candidatus Gottesmanbacteria bacterium]